MLFLVVRNHFEDLGAAIDTGYHAVVDRKHGLAVVKLHAKVDKMVILSHVGDFSRILFFKV